MRNLKINQRTFVALRYKTTEDVVDEQGNKTGEKKVVYYPAKPFKAHISGAKGKMWVEVFGTDVPYDKTILLTKLEFEKLKFDENTVFFIDKKVKFENGIPLYDYRVSKIATTINEVVIAVTKVDK